MVEKTRLIIVRHAEAAGNFKRKFHGWTDEGITERGHEQAKLVAKRLQNTPIDVIYSSTLIRTCQTAEYIAKVKKLSINKSTNLREINGGDWEGIAWEELPQKYPEEFYTWDYKPHMHVMPNGESMEEMLKRVLTEVKNIAEKEKGKNVCIVTHGTAIRAMMTIFKGGVLEDMMSIPWFDNTSVTIVDYADSVFKLVLAGDAEHLGKENSTLLNQDWFQDFLNRSQNKGE